jgi:hypothetical protein
MSVRMSVDAMMTSSFPMRCYRLAGMASFPGH